MTRKRQGQGWDMERIWTGDKKRTGTGQDRKGQERLGQEKIMKRTGQGQDRKRTVLGQEKVRIENRHRQDTRDRSDSEEIGNKYDMDKVKGKTVQEQQKIRNNYMDRDICT